MDRRLEALVRIAGARRGSLTIAMLFVALGGCKSEAPSKERQFAAREAAAHPDAGTPAMVTSQPPGSTSCPAELPVRCPDGCCPDGSSCADGGTGCVSPPAAAGACPAEAPTRCDAADRCDGGSCLTCIGIACRASDESRQGNHATVSHPVTFGAGRFGGGLLFPGSAAQAAPLVTAPPAAFPGGRAPFTISAWVRAEAISAGQIWMVFDYRARTGSSGLSLRGASAPPQAPAFILEGDDSGSWTCFAPAPLSTEDRAWHFLALVNDGTSYTLYLDGAAVPWGTGACGTKSSPLPAAARFALGGMWAGTGGYCLVGGLDEVRVLAFAETPDQIQADFAAGRPGAPPGTLGLWHFDDNTRTWCCPSATGCGAPGGCVGLSSPPAAVCPGAAPVACSDARCCPQGTACAPGGCDRSVARAACASNEVACAEKCCPAGSTCDTGRCRVPPIPLDFGMQCPLNAVCRCGDGGAGLCCGQGVSCTTDCGFCFKEPTLPTSCPGGATLCGDLCCGAGTTCTGGICVQLSDTPVYPVCNQGVPVRCGWHCCPLNWSCGAGGECVLPSPADPLCPVQTPTKCSGSNQCCPSGFTCTSGAVGCLQPQPFNPWSVPHGASCADGGWCAPGEVCTNGRCCPSNRPKACGPACCPSDAPCAGDRCGCRQGEIACGAGCCSANEACEAGVCLEVCPDLEFPLPCGRYCCRAGTACQAGDCVCPADHPVKCGDDCCLPGASCGASGCGCPPGMAECGDECCGGGEVCENGACKAPGSSGGGGDCSGFGQRNCGGSANARLAGDGLCHCCQQVCPGGVCSCIRCPPACPIIGPCSSDGLCLFPQGGTPSQ
jgi:hypothetical protein